MDRDKTTMIAIGGAAGIIGSVVGEHIKEATTSLNPRQKQAISVGGAAGILAAVVGAPALGIAGAVAGGAYMAPKIVKGLARIFGK